MVKKIFQENKRIIIIFAIWWIVINAFAFLSLNRLHLDQSQDLAMPWPQVRMNYSYKLAQGPDSFMGMHVRKQSWKNLDIAKSGYNYVTNTIATNLVVFPLYPFSIRYLGNIFSIDYSLAGFFISNISILISVLVFYKLAQIDFKKAIAERAVLYLLIFPTAFFFTMIYTESLFLLLSLLVFYFALRRQWLLVGLVGFLASLTRISAIFLFLPILYEYFQQEKRFKLNSLFLALIPIGVISFFLYHYYQYGDFFIYFKALKNWDREFLNFSNVLLSSSSSQQTVNSTLEIFFEVIAVAACVLAIRRIRTSYYLYLVISVVIPLLSGSVISTNRYILVMFPLFILFARFGENLYFDRLYTFISILLLSFSTLLLVNYFWIG